MEEFQLNGMISPTQLQSKRIRSPAHIIAYIPTEIMEEILSRLPVKCLFKFRCVSKSWLSLISSKTFIKRHLQSSTRKNLLAISMSPKLNCFSLGSLLRAQFTDAIDIDLPREIQNLQNYSIRAVGHCNGLVCIRVFDTKTHYTSHLFLWNPTTRQSKKIPESGLHCKMDLAIGYGFGFGFDGSTDDYKVVVIVKKQRTSRASAMLYSLNTDLWTEVSCYNNHLFPTHSPCTFVNGKFHWFSRFRFEIVSFDIETKKFGQIDCPHYLHHHDYSFKLFESMGYLSIIAYKLTLTQTSHDLWILKDNGLRQAWTKRYTIPNYVPLQRPVCVRNNGKILWLFGSAFGIYNRKNRSSRYPLTKSINLLDNVIIYVESLVSPCRC